VPLKKLMAFLAFGVLVGPLIGASIGSIGSLPFNPVSVVWPKYLIGDALGVLVMAPLLLVWNEPAYDRSWVERWGAISLSVAVTLMVFRNWGVEWDVSLPYLMLPPLIWTALRMGVRGAAIACFLIAFIANYATATGYGPFAMSSAPHAITLLQGYLLIAIVTALSVAALASDLIHSKEMERRSARHNKELAEAMDELRSSRLHLRKLEGILPICMSCKAVRSDDDREWVDLDDYLVAAEAISLSHTYCPQCAEQAIAELAT